MYVAFADGWGPEPPRVDRDMSTTWQPWSAASLASGAVLLVLGTLMLPSEANVADLIATVQDESGRWIMASFAFFLASLGMTMGLPSVITLLGRRGRRTGMVGIGVWALGTIGLSGYAAMLILFRTMVDTLGDDLTPAHVEMISDDGTLLAFILIFAVAFYVGEFLTAIALLRARTVKRWVAVLLLAHPVLAPLTGLLPEALQNAHILLVGVALMGIAIHANDTWTAHRGFASARLG